MRRSLPVALVAFIGILLLLDFVLINPTLAAVADVLLELTVLVAAGAALAGAVALVLRHWTDLVERRGDPPGSVVLLAGLGLMVIAGFYPGSAGAGDPAVRWLVAAFLAPLIAALFALLFIFVLRALRRGVELRPRQMAVMLTAAGIMLVLLLPIGGAPGEWLAGAAGWALAVPIGSVFRGLLIGIAVATAISAARILLSLDGSDD
ncbi:MAG TPA: hypothetical protein VH987_00105 [Candidatus Limnocylindria bacterium]